MTLFRTAAALAALATALHPAELLAQGTQRMPVTVVDPVGNPVGNALVCAGSEASPALYGAARTDAQGRASIPISSTAPQAGTIIGVLPPMAALVTANVQMPSGSVRGGAARGSIAMGVTVRLQASGGPSCPPGTTPTAAPGTVPIDRNQVIAGLAGQPDRAIGERIVLRRSEHCFGAAGQQCMDRWGRISTCVLGSCLINAGSWKHDECCYADARGYLCSGQFEHVVAPPPGGGNPGINCQVEFYTAFTRLGSIFTWQRSVDFSVANTSGRVDHAAYCARPGSFMFQGEDEMCCSRRSRAPNLAEAFAVARARADNLFLPRTTPARICAA